MSRIAKMTLMLMVATIISKLLGFSRELVLAGAYGTSMYSDAYLIAVNIPFVIFAIIGTAITTTFIPMYFEIENKLGDLNALKFTNNMFNTIALICTVLAIVGLIFTKPIVKLFAVGFEGETLKIAIDFTKILVIGIIFSGLTFMMTAYLQVKNHFIIPGLISIPKNIIVIVSIVLSLRYSPYIMVWGTLLGMLAEFLFQLPFAKKNGYRYKLYINFKDDELKKVGWLLAPVLIGVGVNQINTMVDRTLASTLAEGSISALNYANKLNGFVMALFIASIATIIYPKLSKLSSESNREQFLNSLVHSINSVILLVTPISVGAIVLANPIVKLLFERGEFDIRATNMTAIALSMYSIGMISFGLRDILGKVFYSLKDTRTPMVNGAISMIINIILNIILVRKFKLAGLALATSISASICIILLFISLKKKIGYFGQDKILKTFCKSVIASVIMGAITYASFKFLSNKLDVLYIKGLIPLSLSVVIGLIVYLIGVTVLNIEEVNLITKIIKERLNIKKVLKFK